VRLHRALYSRAARDRALYAAVSDPYYLRSAPGPTAQARFDWYQASGAEVVRRHPGGVEGRGRAQRELSGPMEAHRREGAGLRRFPTPG